MTDQLDDISRHELIVYRMKRAKETIKEAEFLATENYYNATINRLYYAVFYAAQALLLHKDISAKSHNGIKTMLGLHFIAKGKLTIEAGKTYNSLFNLRHSNDYDDFVYCDQQTVDEYLPRAKNFIADIEKLLEQ